MINVFFIKKEEVKTSEDAKEITVKVKCDPNKDDTIEVRIKPNATVSELTRKIEDKLKDDINATRQRSHKKQIKNKSKGDGRNKNRIKLIITGKNFSKTF